MPLRAAHAALAAGAITFKHADAIVDATSDLSVEQARAVATKVLGRAPHQTVGQLRRCLRRAVLAADPDGAAERVRKAHEERTLDWRPLPHGMAEMRLIASATDVMAVYDAADGVAQQMKAAGPQRGTEGWLPILALRADALVHLVAGYGPLPAPLARTLAADGRWRRMVLDPMTGALLDLGTTS